MNIIPAIDLLNGKCVRLYKGNYKEAVIYHENPVDLARQMEDAGIKNLHLIDLDGARSSGSNKVLLNKIAESTNLKIDFGGGLRTYTDVEDAIHSGANQVNIGSMAVNDRTSFIKCLQSFGEKIIWNADLSNGNLAINGWQEIVDKDFNSLLLQYKAEGLQWVLSTDISKDGTLEGPNVAFYKKMIASYPEINWIASGGVSSKEDLVMLKRSGLSAVIVGKALYTGNLSFIDLVTAE